MLISLENITVSFVSFHQYFVNLKCHIQYQSTCTNRYAFHPSQLDFEIQLVKTPENMQCSKTSATYNSFLFIIISGIDKYFCSKLRLGLRMRQQKFKLLGQSNSEFVLLTMTILKNAREHARKKSEILKRVFY